MPRAQFIDGQWLIHCPACKHPHGFIPGRWTFDGNVEKPTFHPSMKITVNPKDHKYHNPNAKTSVCHSFVRNGRIEYCSDCTHDFRGQTVDLPEISDSAKN